MQNSFFVLSLFLVGSAYHAQSQIKTAEDSLIYIQELEKLKRLDEETAAEIKTWTEEEKQWFAKTFVFKRGQFTLPKVPLRSLKKD